MQRRWREREDASGGDNEAASHRLSRAFAQGGGGMHAVVFRLKCLENFERCKYDLLSYFSTRGKQSRIVVVVCTVVLRVNICCSGWVAALHTVFTPSKQ